MGFGSPANTLTEPVWDTVKRDVWRILVNNLKLVLLLKRIKILSLFIAFSSVLILSLCSFQSEVFAVAFALLAAGAVILTLNVLLLGGHIIFFQSLSLLGYCLFPLDVGAVICMLKDNVILKNDRCVFHSCPQLLGCLSFHERCCEPEKKSSRPLSCLPHVCLCRLLDHCH
ncbi:unnamed protein product [Brassica rapa subsp. narinosa]